MGCLVRDRATTHDLSGAISALLPALERFLRFEGPDPARSRSHWRPLLDRRFRSQASDEMPYWQSSRIWWWRTGFEPATRASPAG